MDFRRLFATLNPAERSALKSALESANQEARAKQPQPAPVVLVDAGEVRRSTSQMHADRARRSAEQYAEDRNRRNAGGGQ